MPTADCLNSHGLIGTSRCWGGEVRGQLIGEQGAPLANFRVSIHLRSIPVHRLSPESATYGRTGFNQEIRTNQAGSFSFVNVPAGLLQICAVESGDYFDPCFWSRSENLIDHRGETLQALAAPVRLRLGHRLRVTVRDGQALLPFRDLARLRAPLDEEIQVSVRTPVLGFWTAPPKATAQGRYFEFLVPYDLPIPVNIETGSARLRDADSGRVSVRQGGIHTFLRSRPQNLTFDVVR